MITVTEVAKRLFQDVEHPEGTVLRLDPVTDQSSGRLGIGISIGEPKGDDRVVEHDGEDLPRIEASVSETLDGGVLNLVETPEGTGIGLTPPEDGPLTDGS
jgi:iron-sulfur cluster assembly protein